MFPQAWENHLRRNRSIVVDLFHGQLRSQVKCKTCGHVSARFDPFNFLSLPLPMDNSMHVEIIGEPYKSNCIGHIRIFSKSYCGCSEMQCIQCNIQKIHSKRLNISIILEICFRKSVACPPFLLLDSELYSDSVVLNRKLFCSCCLLRECILDPVPLKHFALCFLCPVTKLDGSCPVRYGLRLNADEKYTALKRLLSELCCLNPEQILLAEVHASNIKVGPSSILQHCTSIHHAVNITVCT